MAKSPEDARMQNLRRQAQINALRTYVSNPSAAYGRDSGKFLSDFLKSEKAVVPKGREVFRSLSDFDVNKLPKQVGQSYRPGGVTSVAGPEDLQMLGKVVAGDPDANMGGNNAKANALARITMMEDVPGIENVRKYLPNLLNDFTSEGMLGPKTRFEVQGYTAATKNTPATWNLGAYANMGLGALNILGFLPMLNQGGKIMQGKQVLPEFKAGDFRG